MDPVSAGILHADDTFRIGRTKFRKTGEVSAESEEREPELNAKASDIHREPGLKGIKGPSRVYSATGALIAGGEA